MSAGGREIIEKLAFLIEATDSYRVGRNTDLRKVDNAMNELSSLPILDASTKKKYRKVVESVINLPRKNRRAFMWAQLYVIFRFLVRVSFIGFLLSIGLIFYRNPLSGYLLLSSTALLYVALIGRWYSLLKLLDFYEAEMKNQPGKDEFLKEFAQKLIEELRSKLREQGVKPTKVRLHLFRRDYSGIRVLKKPGWLRDYYLAEVEL